MPPDNKLQVCVMSDDGRKPFEGSQERCLLKDTVEAWERGGAEREYKGA